MVTSVFRNLIPDIFHLFFIRITPDEMSIKKLYISGLDKEEYLMIILG